MKETINNFLDVAIKAAKEAGNLALRLRENLDVSKKNDKTFVTNADIQAEKKIIQIIKKGFPDHKMHGEELGTQGKSNSQYLWAIDPIDGTSAYLSQENTFCTSIALIKNKKPILAVIYNPCTNELFTTSGKMKTKLNNKPLPKIKTNSLKESSVNCQVSRENARDYQKIFESLWGEGEINKATIHGGSPSYNIAQVAKGSYAHFIMQCYRKANPEDYSAGYLILKNAGGIITNLEGKEINPLTHMGYFVASNNKKHHKHLIKLLSEIDFSKEPNEGKLVMIGGFYGTGKSTLAIKLKTDLNYERYNSDLIRQELKLQSYDKSDSDFIWGAIHMRASQDLAQGKGAIIESTLLNEEQRTPELNIIQNNNADGLFIEVVCPEAITKQRIKSRPVSPDGIHVPTNKIKSYNKIKDSWEPVIPNIKKRGLTKVSYIIYNSKINAIHEALVRPRHKEWISQIAEILKAKIKPQNSKIINAERRYNINE